VTFGSLFAGIGGLDLGLERAGFTCRWQVEINPFSRAVLAKHWPDVARFEDVRTVGAHNLEPVDLICGGFPCQDISNAGKRVGITGERSGLWTEYARVVRELRPRLVLVENVAALLTRGFDVVLGDLAALGFDAEWTVLRASDVGAPHRRERLFVVAHAERLAGGDDEQWDLQREALDRQEPREAGARRVADADGGRRSRIGIAESRRLEGARGDLADGSGGDGRELDAAAVADTALRVFAYRPDPAAFGPWPAGPGEQQHDWEPARTLAAVADAAGILGAGRHGEADEHAARPNGDRAGTVEGDEGRGSDEAASSALAALGRVPDGIPAALVRKPHGVLEAPSNRRQQLEAYGNAVVPQIAEWIGRRILDAEVTA
jgi:site-specific DNA-cytosine methylase